MRLVLDEGSGARQIVLRLERSIRSEPDTLLDPIFVDYLQRLLHAFGPGPEDPATPAASEVRDLVVPLTASETKVLRLLAAGDSNRVISGKLFVSESTVCTHVRKISQKLDTHSRTQAVAKARLLGLIS